MLGLATGTAALRKVTLRSADREALRVRRGFERAVATVDWRPAGLPTGAILLVRRLTAMTDDSVQAPFGERVTQALRRHADRARRPWIERDVADAEAVFFADEAELVACLARDWLRGLVADRWWWRTVLGSVDVHAWIRRHALPRGEVLVPAMALLAASRQAVAFVARLEPLQCAEALEAIARSHGVAMPVMTPEREIATKPARAGRPRQLSRNEQAAQAIRHQALVRLSSEAPEALASGLAPVQRQLLAMTLALSRAPAWVRKPQFAHALDELAKPDVVRPAASLREDPHEDVPEPSLAVAQTATAAVDDPETDVAAPATPLSQHSRIARRKSRGARATRLAAQLHDEPAAPAPQSHGTRGTGFVPEASVGAASSCDETSFASAQAPEELHLGDDSRETASTTTAVAHTALDELARTPTGFGGVFYLLNAAIAMGLYGDFTMPRAPGLALSPWDWLALVGREWFGDAFVEDPAWTMLAGLAGRAPDEEPGRDFDWPAHDWLATQVAALHERLALALDACEWKDIPAFVCRYAAQVEVSPTTVHVHLALADLPLDIRIAGLDRDPGWIPAAGRSVRFHFD